MTAARLTTSLTALAGHAGTSLPGLVANRVAPGIAGRLANELGPITLVSGTNGKTTTVLTLATILRSTGRPAISNPSGANLGQAVATAIVLHGSESAPRDRRQHAVFEVDEAALPGLLDEIAPAVLLLTNLFRDQLDRFGETDQIIRLWRTALERHPAIPIVYCADDPRLAALVRDRPGALSYGFAEQPVSGSGGGSVTTDISSCPRCGGPLVTEWVSIGHLGAYRCPACRFGRPAPWVLVRVSEDHGLHGQTLAFTLGDGRALTASLPLIGTANAYNAAGALTAALALGVEPTAAAAALASVSPAFARWETLLVDGRKVVLSLVKNPASMDEVTRAGSTVPADAVLFAMNDQFADGRDVSWYWDVDPTPLVTGRTVAISGTRGPDLLLRLRYQLARLPDQPLEGFLGLFDRPIDALDALIRHVPEGGSLLVVSTYTALLGLRAALVQRGLATSMPR